MNLENGMPDPQLVIGRAFNLVMEGVTVEDRMLT